MNTRSDFASIHHVWVNHKYIVRVIADNNAAAEHKCLEIPGVESALSFNFNAIQGELFAYALCTSEMVPTRAALACILSADYE